MNCEDVLELLKEEPKIKNYLKVLNSTPIDVLCKVCSTAAEENARAYLASDPLSIVLCSNRLRTKQAIEEALTHELVHAVDYVLERYDFSTCKGLAFSEVRAARDAECNRRFYFDFSKKRCIRQTAVDSTKVCRTVLVDVIISDLLQNLFPYDGADCVNKVFEDAMKDMFPDAPSVAAKDK